MHEKLTSLLKNAGYLDPSASSRNPEHNEDRANGPTSALNQAIATANQNILQLSAVTQTAGESLSANTDALNKSSESREASNGGVMGAIQRVTTGLTGGSGGLLGGGLLGGGLGLLFDGIKSLFGGGSSAPPALPEYVAPPKNNFELATSNGLTGDAVYNSYGAPRSAQMTEPAFSGMPLSPANSAQQPAPSNTPRQPVNSTQNITVHVQAMDSRSFLDHSEDIASAVRQAMLNMHSINDVVNDL